MIKTELIPYMDQETALEGFAAYPSKRAKRPLVILCHAWKGRDDFICEKAVEIAGWGYACFALDMYGKGILGKSKEENAALKKPFLENRVLLKRRLLRAYEIASSLPFVDSDCIGALGLGFGGVCSLDLARSGAALKCAVSIYGHFDPPPGLPKKKIQAKILALHGYNDPIVPPEELLRFEKEMEEAEADWQLHVFGNTLHAFATPSAQDPKAGMAYQPTSAKRSWNLIQNFIKEVFEHHD